MQDLSPEYKFTKLILQTGYPSFLMEEAVIQKSSVQIPKATN